MDGMVEYSNDVKIWYEAKKTGCPFIRFHEKLGKWVTLGLDPCPTRLCLRKSCWNYGGKFHESDRLIVVKLDE